MSLGLAPAERSACAAMAHAASLDITICLAVCDRQGRLTVFFKMNGIDALAGHEAIRRAGTGLASDGAAREPDQAKSASEEGFGLSFRPGGIPLIVDGARVGGIGVCGGTALQDVGCARVGAAVFRT